MKEAVLIISLTVIFVLGYFVMGRLDKFLENNRKAIRMNHEKKEPSCVMLTDDLKDEEIAAEIRRFRERHVHARIILCDSDDAALSSSTTSRKSHRDVL